MKEVVFKSIFGVLTQKTTHTYSAHAFFHLSRFSPALLVLGAGRVSWEAPHMFWTDVTIISCIFSVELMNEPLPGNLQNNLSAASSQNTMHVDTFH